MCVCGGYDLTIQRGFFCWFLFFFSIDGMEKQTNTKSKITLTAYSISLFSHEQLCKIATAPVNKINTEKKRHMNNVSTYHL